jgi:hypothetical protein
MDEEVGGHDVLKLLSSQTFCPLAHTLLLKGVVQMPYVVFAFHRAEVRYGESDPHRSAIQGQIRAKVLVHHDAIVSLCAGSLASALLRSIIKFSLSALQPSISNA